MENLEGSAAQRPPIPWQDRGKLGMARAIWNTIKFVLFRPREFFENLKIKDSIKEPYLFYFIVSLSAGIIGLAFGMLFEQGANLTVFISVSLILLVFVATGIFVTSAILHLGVMLLGGKGGFKGTFNVLAYNASTSIFSVIPFIGGFISGIWAIIVGVKGFKRVHNLSTIRATIAYFGVFFIVAIIAIFAAIAIPNFLKARIAANESSAKQTVNMLSAAMEAYAALNDNLYPASEDDLKAGGYTPEYYDKSTNHGYTYSLSFSPDGYGIIAQPQECGVTGKKVFLASPKGEFAEKDCK